MEKAVKTAHRIVNQPWKHALVALIAFILVYILASIAIDTARWSAYFGTLLFLIIGVRHLVWAIKKDYAGKV